MFSLLTNNGRLKGSLDVPNPRGKSLKNSASENDGRWLLRMFQG